MAITPRNRTDSHLWHDSPTARRYYLTQAGWDGGRSPMVVLPYVGTYTRNIQRKTFGLPIPPTDAGNVRSTYDWESKNGCPDWAVPRRNAAYAEFRDRALGATSQIGVAIAEARESWGMVGSRLISIADALKDIRRGKLPGAFTDRSVNRDRKRRRPGQWWLEYWFGWSPLISDVQDGLETLEKPLPYGEPAWGSATATHYKRFPNYPMNYEEYSASITFKTGAVIDLINPNLALANQLGLVNLFQTAVEVVPFSFLADWAFDVNQWIGSYSDFIGLNLRHQYQTSFMRSYDTISKVPYPQATQLEVYESFCHRRDASLIRPIPNVQVLQNLGRSITRAASAASLISELLQGARPSRT